MDQPRIEYVDVLRGIAVLSVLLLHFMSASSALEQLPASLQFIVEQGGRGVQLFFVASAFTLFRSYHHRAKVDLHPARNFFIRRYFRVAPMYYVGIAYFLFQNGFAPTQFLDGTFQNTPGNILANLFFVNEFNPYYLWLVPGSWSVAAEMLFYLLVPFLFRWIPDLRSAIRFLGIALVIRAISWYGFSALTLIPDPMVRIIYAGWVLPTQLPVFALGILLFFLMRGDAWPKLGKWDLLFWLMLVVAEVMSQGGRLFPLEVVLSAGFVLMALVFSQWRWDHWLGWALRHIGKVSYSMYLIHWGVLYWLDKGGLVMIDLKGGWLQLTGACLWRGALVLALTVLISTASQALIEKPGQQLGVRLIGYLDRRSLAKTPRQESHS